jgi:hypothetical protein
MRSETLPQRQVREDVLPQQAQHKRSLGRRLNHLFPAAISPSCHFILPLTPQWVRDINSANRRFETLALEILATE